MNRSASELNVALLWLVCVASLFLNVFCGLLRIGSLQFLAGLQIFSASCFLLFVIFSRKNGGISFLIALQYFFFISIPTYFQIYSGIFPFFGRPSVDCQYLAFSMISLMYACVLLGFRIGWRKGSTKISPSPVKYKNLTLWAWCLGIAAMIMGIAAGPDLMLTARHEASEIASTEGGISQQLQFISRSIGLVSFLMILSLAKSSPKGVQAQNRFAMGVAIPCMLFLFFPPSLPRTFLIGPILAITAVYFDFHRPWIKFTLTLASYPVIFFIFPAIKVLGSGGSIADFIDGIGSRTIGEYIVRVDFDLFLWTAETISYLQNGGAYRMGANFLGFVLFFVPRAIWPSKPGHSGELVSQATGYIYPNVSSPIWSEAILSFGLPGAVLIMVLVGFFAARLEGSVGGLDEQTGRTKHVIMLISMAYIMILFRGALNAVAPGVASAFAVAILVHSLSGSKVTMFQRRAL